MRFVSPPVRALLAGAIDYAGLFPPAELDMRSAVANYLGYQSSSEAWALGRFVAPASRLDELAGAIRESGGPRRSPIPVSALIGVATAADLELVEEFSAGSRSHGARVGAVEVKAPSAGVVRAVLAGISAGWIRYLEVPLGENTEAVLDAVAAGGACAKVRTGGTTIGAFPDPDELLQFLRGVIRRGIPFKATAGLHHPLRGSYRLTYAADAACGPMYGYLNVMLAAAVLHGGGDASLARMALLEEDPGALRAEGDSIHWRAQRLATPAIAAMRRGCFHGFGSCSFREPLDELSLPEAA